MKFKEWKQQLRDGSELQMYEWKPANDKDIRGVVQLVDGSAEHSLRYEDFAKFLVANNYAVVAEDHRGHGKTATCSENLGFFAEEEGWEKIIDDLYEVITYIKHCYPNRPIVMFGHSMGSFMVRHYAIKYGTNIAALVICGTAHYPKRLLKFSIKMARIGQKIKGPKLKDNFIYKFSYSPLNVRYKDEGNLRTEWLATLQMIFIKIYALNNDITAHIAGEIVLVFQFLMGIIILMNKQFLNYLFKLIMLIFISMLFSFLMGKQLLIWFDKIHNRQILVLWLTWSILTGLIITFFYLFDLKTTFLHEFAFNFLIFLITISNFESRSNDLKVLQHSLFLKILLKLIKVLCLLDLFFWWKLSKKQCKIYEKLLIMTQLN